MYINIPADMFALGVKGLGIDLENEESCKRTVEEYLSTFINIRPSVIIINVCYRRSLIKSEIFDTVLNNIKKDAQGNVIKTLSPSAPQVSHKYFETFFEIHRKLLSNNIDIFQMAVDCCKKNNISVWFSFRMNDYHFLQDPAINSSFSLDNPQYCIDDIPIFNYAVKEVRVYWMSYIKELLNNYQIDGIELDWLRGLPYFRDNQENKCEILTDFVSAVKSCLTKADKKLAVRVLAWNKNNIDGGLDVASWVGQGYVDVVTISNYHVPTGFDFPIRKWREDIAQHNTQNNPYLLLAGCDYGAGCSLDKICWMSPALVRGFRKASINAGADDVYIFNIAVEDNTTSIFQEKTGRFVEGLTEILQAGNDDDGECRFIYIKGSEFHGGSDYRFPISLKPNEEYICNMDMAIGAKKGYVYLGIEKEVQIELIKSNHRFIFEKIDTPKELPAYGTTNDWTNHISQVAPVVFCSEVIEFLGDVNFVIKNTGNEETKIVWIELLQIE